MHKNAIIVSLLSAIVAQVVAWNEYTEPIVFPPKQAAPFVFEMEIDWKLTMSYPTEFNLIELIDYFPNDTKPWFVRNKDQLMACDLKDQLSSPSLLANVVQMHGLHQRVVTINGVSPAKTMVVPLGAEVIMRVHNNLLLEGITVHLHGMDKKNLWYTDGVALVQQCPIPVGSSYSYRFIADTAGTLWWHGHLGTDRGEGLLGAFIVARDDENVTDSTGARVSPSRQYVALIQDWPEADTHSVWYNQKWKTMKFMYGYDNWKDCWAPTRTYDGTNVGGSVPLNGILINDKGWYDQKAVKTIPWKLPLEKFKIKPNEKIVIRLINGGTAQEMMVGIEGHKLTIVAADGVPVQPLVVDFVVLFSGERYDVLIEGKPNPDRKTYYIIVETEEYYDWHWNNMEPYFGLGKLEYEGDWPVLNQAPDITHSQCTQASKCLVLNPPFGQYPDSINLTSLSPAELKSLEPITDTEIISDQGFNGGYQEHFMNMHFDSHVDGWKFQQPKGMPYFYHGRENDVVQWCDPSKCAPDASEYDTGCNCFVHYNLTLNNVVQMTIYNMGSGSEVGHSYAHPVHIHGTHFYLLKVAYPTYDEKGWEDMPNPDIPCGKQYNSTGSCNNLTWANPNWMNGRVGGMNTKDPSSRDTVVVPVGGYIVIRFRADNPGWFYGHCHVMMHHMGGTAFALRVGEHEQMPVPPPGFPSSCGIYEAPPLGDPQTSTTSTTKTTPGGSNVSQLSSVLLIAVITSIIFNVLKHSGLDC